jgi:hypothetical protein
MAIHVVPSWKQILDWLQHLEELQEFDENESGKRSVVAAP